MCGSDKLRRTEVVKQLWVYIKKHDLQSEDDKRVIECDDALTSLFDGNETVGGAC